ncbi:hypothetical protein AURDEDRAFT_185493 [Auricularia subglabra TFB-10046 SS5]|nr:hypothetical protein AURDEDRAFT_185493 [Auricularia subglabra TFB-10046 SS5]
MKREVLRIKDTAYDSDDMPELCDLSDSSESESGSESELGGSTRPRRIRVSRAKRGADGRPVWPVCAANDFLIAFTVAHQQLAPAQRIVPSYATHPRRNQFLANQFFERTGSRRTRAQVSNDLEKRRKWYQGRAHGNK